MVSLKNAAYLTLVWDKLGEFIDEMDTLNDFDGESIPEVVMESIAIAKANLEEYIANA